jgi:hypothetical protein
VLKFLKNKMKLDGNLNLKVRFVSSEYSTDQALLDENNKIICLNFNFNFLFFEFFKNLFCIKNKKKLIILKNIIIYILNANKNKGYQQMYELCQNDDIIFFFKNKRIIIDKNSGNNNKIDIFFLSSEKFFSFLQFMFWKIKKGKNSFLFI